MKLYKIVILGVAAWAGTIYYQRFHALTSSDGSLGTTVMNSYRGEPRYHFMGKSDYPTGRESSPIGGIGGTIGGVGAGSTRGWIFSSTPPDQMGSSTGMTQDLGYSYDLIEAAAEGDVESVKELIEDGVKIDSRDGDKRTALMYAAWNGHTEICGRLLAAGANIRLKDDNDNTAYDYAAGRGLTETVQYLLKNARGKDANHYVDYSTLIRAAYAASPASFPAGKGTLPYVDRINPEGHAPLHIVAGNGSVETAEALVKRGAKIRIANKEGQTPLHWAAWNNKAAMVKWLLEKGMDVTAQDSAGNTALILAAQNNSVDAAKILLEKGARRTAANKQGKTAWIIAEDNGHHELALMLQ